MLDNSRRSTSLAALPVVALACLGLAACGGSSNGPNNTTAAAASSAATQTGTNQSGATPGSPQNRGQDRFAQLRACLSKNGITLPQRTPGAPPAGTGGRPGNGPGAGTGNGAGGPGARPGSGFFRGLQPPKGVTPANFQAALKKCGGAALRGLGGARNPGAAQRFSNPQVRQALTKFLACMGQNGVKLPTPNTSGKGPVFDTNKVNTAAPKFRAAAAKCTGALSIAGRGSTSR
ncbi:MAG TPA: hypothetical protein VLJ42_08090 [Solirubrobacteraceae bacterium]|nr:hypothetical protein [Solirubrobacteraceae bacterium]